MKFVFSSVENEKERRTTFAAELSPPCKSHFTSSLQHFSRNYSLDSLNGDFILPSVVPDLARRGLVIGDSFSSRL